jgi:hypothetical protein
MLHLIVCVMYYSLDWPIMIIVTMVENKWHATFAYIAYFTLQNFDYDEMSFKLGTCLFQNPWHATHDI